MFIQQFLLSLIVNTNFILLLILIFHFTFLWKINFILVNLCQENYHYLNHKYHKIIYNFYFSMSLFKWLDKIVFINVCMIVYWWMDEWVNGYMLLKLNRENHKIIGFCYKIYMSMMSEERLLIMREQMMKRSRAGVNIFQTPKFSITMHQL